jgi:hypothetical protein
MASKAPKTPEEIANIKAAAVAKQKEMTRLKIEHASGKAASALACGHQTVGSFLTMVVTSMTMFKLCVDDVLKDVISRALDAKGVVLCVTEDTPVIEFGEVTQATLKQLAEKSEQNPPKSGHDHEFTLNGLGLVREFYNFVIGRLSKMLDVMYSSVGFGDMDSDKMGVLLEMVGNMCGLVDIAGLCVEGMYVGPNANSVVCSWNDEKIRCYSFRALLKSENIGYSMATSETPTHLAIINSKYLRLVAKDAKPTPTNYAEVTIVFELNDGIITVRPGTWFPSKLNAEAAAVGVAKFATLVGKK